MKKERQVILFINTAKPDEVVVSLWRLSDKKLIRQIKKKVQAQMTLNLIEQLLKKERLTFDNLAQVEVKLGPGSFTGLRVGVAIANTLAFLLKIPVNGKLPPVFPKY